MDLENNQPQTTTESVPPTLNQLNFFGKTDEYFGIWIVNILLTLITLGIYSAWAKVRRINYMLGNTELNGHRFKYLAKPINILKGRIIAIIAIGIALIFMGFAQETLIKQETFVQIPGFIALYLAFYLFASVLIWKGLQFSFRMISYRGVQFGFHGSYRDTFFTFFVYPLVAAFSFGVLGPVALNKFARFMSTNVKYGDLSFNSNLTIKSCIKPFLAMVCSLILLVVIPMSLFAVTMFATGMDSESSTPGIGFMVAYIMLLLGVFTINGLFVGIIRNLVVRNITLGNDSHFDSTISLPKLIFILVTNALAIVCTLGFGTPWAQIRKTRYLTESTFAALSDEVDTVVSNSDESPSAIGVEGAELMDVGIGL